METRKDIPHFVSIDDLLAICGEYGRFQKLLNIMLCLMAIPSYIHTMLMYFTADFSSWRCLQANSTDCVYNATYENSDRTRCKMPRQEWEYTDPPAYSLLAYYNVDCSNEWLIELVTSIFFVGWIFGAIILGWCCDNVGRKRVLLVSIVAVISTGLLTIFMPNIYLFIVCRFIIGFFVPGCISQMFIIMTEIVGSRYRSFASLCVFEFGVVSTVILGTIAYFVRDWKQLHIACTVPYIVVVFFFKFIPESVRYQRVKGQHRQLMHTFQTIASWNKRKVPDNVTIEPLSADDFQKKSNPLELFRTKGLIMRTAVQIVAFFSSGLLYYGVYLAANDLGGEKYRDFVILSVTELPIVFLTIYLCERYGRKKPCTLPLLLSCVAFLALSFTPKSGHLKIFRVVFGIFGKCLMGSNMDVLHTWATELYPTRIRGEAIGVFQAALRVGAASAPWLDKELGKISNSASFLFMAALALISFCLLLFLPETKGSGMDECSEETEEEDREIDDGGEKRRDESGLELNASRRKCDKKISSNNLNENELHAWSYNNEAAEV